jgi:acetylornithine deacetylase/succinyl-diaminopimelate desuccinylase-like protein
MFILSSILNGIAVLMLTMMLAVALFSRQPDNILPGTPDPQIAAALREVSAGRIRQTIEKLVSFDTRQTLSSDMPASSGKGATAAAEWIRSEFARYAKECGGCLEVKTDEFTQEPGPRVPKSTKITNVYAVLRGTNPANAGRMYIVSGHYDSRNSDTNDAAGPAPGANDDGSGTAVSLECARVLSKHRFPATLIFLAVAGEEQGLDGSGHFAKDGQGGGLGS